MPIPAFYRTDGSIVVGEDISNAVADSIEKYGTNIWWERSGNELFPAKVYCSLLVVISACISWTSITCSVVRIIVL